MSYALHTQPSRKQVTVAHRGRPALDPARRWTSRTVGSSVRELLLMVAVFMAYRQVRYLTSGDLPQARANADRVVETERMFGIFSERSLQRLVMHFQPAIEFLDHYYVFVHFTASVGFMAWVFLRHPQAWGRVRAWFLSVTLAGLAIHVAFPLAPPRMLDQHGFVDTLHVYGPSIYSEDVTASAANQLAAMPSLHFAWAAIVAVGFITICRSRWSMLMLLHPVVTLLAIVATANHYWLDAIIGGGLVVVAVVGTHLVRRSFRRPEHLVPVATPVAGHAVHLPHSRCSRHRAPVVGVASRIHHVHRQLRPAPLPEAEPIAMRDEAGFPA